MWPHPIIGDSGNGGHLLWRVDLPNDSDTTKLFADCLKVLSFKFDDDAVKVDTTTFNPGRPWKLYGTLVGKGDNILDHPPPPQPHHYGAR